MALTRWFDAHHLQPRIRGEFQDIELAAVLCRDGEGVLAAPSTTAEQMQSHYRLVVIAELAGVRARFYSVTAERKVSHPAVRAIVGNTRLRSVRP
jgi:LysR family transcriptional activator of nhaA